MKRISSLTSLLTQFALSKTAQNTYFVFLGNGLSIFLAFVYTVTLVGYISLADFGYFSALLSLLLLISEVADLGIGNSLSRFLPPMGKENLRISSFLKTAFFLQLAIASFLTFLIVVFSKDLAEVLFHNKNLNFLINITSVGIFAIIMANFFQYILSAKQKFIKAALVTSLGGILRVVFLLFLIITSSTVLTNVVWMQSLTFLLLAFFALVLTRPDFLFVKREKGDLRSLISFSSYLGIARALTAISGRLDVLMLIALRNPVEAGIYSIASRVVSIYPLFAGSFTMVIAPKISSMSDHLAFKKYLVKVIISTLGLIASILIFILIAKPFMIILFGEKSIPAISVLRLLLVSMIFFVGSIPAVGLSVYYLKKPQILTINSILQLIIVVLGNFYFIPRFGRFGPAFSLIAAYGISLFLTSYLSLYFFRKHTRS